MNLVFDFGAVLIDWQPARLVAQYFPELTVASQTAEALARAIFSHEDWHAFDRGTVTQEEVTERTARRLGLPHARLHALVNGIGERLTPLDESVAVLVDLVDRRKRRADVSLYYLSNMPVPYARVLEQAHAFLRWFDGGIFSGDVQSVKPEPGIFQLLQTRYALEPGRTLLIDDLQSNVNAACAMGWQGLQFTSAQQLRSDLDTLIGS